MVENPEALEADDKVPGLQLWAGVLLLCSVMLTSQAYLYYLFFLFEWNLLNRDAVSILSS
jgi:hypothetical protein